MRAVAKEGRRSDSEDEKSGRAREAVQLPPLNKTIRFCNLFLYREMTGLQTEGQ
jgi:hypothetical protein